MAAHGSRFILPQKLEGGTTLLCPWYAEDLYELTTEQQLIRDVSHG